MRILAAIVLLVALVPCQAQAPAPALQKEDERTRKAHALLDQMMATMGGQAWLTLRDSTWEGRTYGFSHGESGGGAPFWRSWKWPDKERIELTKQRDWIIIHDGDQGWEITFKGTAPEDPESLEPYRLRRPFSLEHVLREWLNQPSTVV